MHRPLALVILSLAIVCTAPPEAHGMYLQAAQRAAANAAALAIPAYPDAADAPCAVVEAWLPRADSIEVQIVQPRCGPLRLVLVGAPNRRIDLTPGSCMPVCVWDVPVALENAGDSPIALPVTVHIDSANPVQRGRRLSASYALGYFEAQGLMDDRRAIPWEFASSGAPGDRLAPGARTATRTLRLVTRTLAQGIRVALDVPAVRAPRPLWPVMPPVYRSGPDTMPLGVDVERFVARARFPDVRTIRPRFRQPEHGLLIFDVDYGSPHDCPAGCFYSRAVGLRLGSTIGWIDLHDYDRTPDLDARVRRTWFVPKATDRALFSLALLDTLATWLGPSDHIAQHYVPRLVIGSPHVPRGILVALTERSYTQSERYRAELLADAPVAQDDIEILTLLASLSRQAGGRARTTARAALRRHAPALVRDPHASARTLFVLAQTLQPMSADTLLMSQLAEHPAVRGNPAILAVLSEHHRALRPRVLDAVRASEPVKRLLAEFLERGDALRGPYEPGRRLLRDPEAGSNPDVLAVLANVYLGHNQEVTLTASRRLPESALLLWEGPYVPLR